MFCSIGMKLSMCLIDDSVHPPAVFLWMLCHNGHFSLGHSGAQQELIPGGLSYLLGGYSVVGVVVLNSLQVKHFINQTVFSICVFIIAIFQTPKVEFIFWKRLHKYKLEHNFFIICKCYMFCCWRAVPKLYTGRWIQCWYGKMIHLPYVEGITSRRDGNKELWGTGTGKLPSIHRKWVKPCLKLLFRRFVLWRKCLLIAQAIGFLLWTNSFGITKNGQEGQMIGGHWKNLF